MGGKSAPPPAPDMIGASIAQGALGLQNTVAQSQLNNPNISTPFGSISYGQGGGQPNYGTGYGMPTPTGAGLGSKGGGPMTPPQNSSMISPGGTTQTAGGQGQSPFSGVTVGGGNATSPASGINLDPAGTSLYSHLGSGGQQIYGMLNPVAGALGGKGKGQKGQQLPSYNLGSLLGGGSPGGGTDYRQTQTTTLAPEQQALLNSQNVQKLGLSGAGLGVLPALSNVTGKIDYSGLPQANQGADQLNQSVTQALYNQRKQYLDPQFAQQGEAMDANLRAQGLVPGSQAYQAAQTNFGNQRQQAYGDALNSAQELGLQGGQMAQQENLAARNQGIGEQLQNQQLPLQLIQSLLGFTTPTGPSGAPIGQVGAADPANLLGAQQGQYSAQLGNTNAANAQAASTTQGLGSLAMMAAMMFCWVAYEIYGEAPEFWAARRWIKDEWKGPVADAVRWAYRRFGPRFSLWLRAHPWAKPVIRPLFDVAVRKANATRNP